MTGTFFFLIGFNTKMFSVFHCRGEKLLLYVNDNTHLDVLKPCMVQWKKTQKAQCYVHKLLP